MLGPLDETAVVGVGNAYRVAMARGYCVPEGSSMTRSSIAIVAATMLAFATPAAAEQSPGPAPSGFGHAARFSSKVQLPDGAVSSVSSSACSRSTVTVNNSQGALGPNGATKSQTLMAVPIGGGNVSSTTTQQQIFEACAQQRR
jgi:hypothetical protein